MRTTHFQSIRVERDHAFVEHEVDELIEHLYQRSKGDNDRFTEMLAHFVSMSVAPSIAATNRVLRLPSVSAQNTADRVRISLEGDSEFESILGKLESDLAEALTTAVLQTLLGPSPRISSPFEDDSFQQINLN